MNEKAPQSIAVIRQWQNHESVFKSSSIVSGVLPRAASMSFLYITEDSHMRPEHLYYKEVNAKDGAYYRRWASVFGPSMSEFIDRVLKAPKHEEQAYNSCAGILHSVKELPHGIVEEAARQCIQMGSCRYRTFKQVLGRIRTEGTHHPAGTLPQHENNPRKGLL